MDLAHPGRQDRLDALAAQYALGTLRGPARDRFTRAMRSDPAVAAAARAWERRLAGLAAEVPPVTPPPRVWTAIAGRLGLKDAGRPVAGWWDRLGLWRGLAIDSLAGLVALGVTDLARPPAGESLVVVLAGSDSRPAMVATALSGDRVITLKPVQAADPGPGRSFELWALPDGAAPRSLGVIPRGDVVRLPLPGREALAGIPALAVSLEPAGGSPTGALTGPVVYTGRIERMF
jgi:anti-sigma-K factor RskA